MIHPLLLALFLMHAEPVQNPPFRELDVRSPNGRFVAELRRAAGQERVPAVSARWALTVAEHASGEAPRAMWSSAYPYGGPQGGDERWYLLSDDGVLFVHVAPWLSEAKPAVRVYRSGTESLCMPASQLALDTSAMERTPRGRRWIAESPSPVRLAWVETAGTPAMHLQVDTLAGSTLSVDLALGRVVDAEDQAPEVRVEPTVPDHLAGATEAPFVSTVDVPEFARAGAPVLVRLHGSHPTPGWKLLGFELSQGSSENELVLTPRSLRPEGPALQVLSPLEACAELHGLLPGRHRVRIAGRGSESPWGEVEVLPAGIVLRLHVTGGFMGADDTLSIFDTGVGWRLAKRPVLDVKFHLPPDVLAAIDAALPSLAEAKSPPPSAGADLFGYELGWWDGERWRRLLLDDVTLQVSPAGELPELIGRLRALGTP